MNATIITDAELAVMMHPEYDHWRSVVVDEEGCPLFPKEYRRPKPVVTIYENQPESDNDYDN